VARKQTWLHALLIGTLITGLAATAAWYLTFSLPRRLGRTPAKEQPPAPSQEYRKQEGRFHLSTPDLNLAAWEQHSPCIICHSAYPHGKDRQVMAIINLHTEFLTCDCCHLKNELHEIVRFGWVQPPGIATTGKPYGTAIDPATGFFAATDDHYSLITPLHEVDGRWVPFFHISEDAVTFARSYLQRKATLSKEEHEQIVAQAHQGTETKQFVRCSQCHSHEGIMDFRALGFDQTRTSQLEKLEVSGMLTNYEVFYFPDLFEKKFR